MYCLNEFVPAIVSPTKSFDKVNFENLIIADLPFFLFFGNFAKMVNNHVGAHLITGCLCAASKHISAI